jgi:hypothetical protein
MFRATASIDGSLTARLGRGRQSGYAEGEREARLMLLALGKVSNKAKLSAGSTP